MLVKNFKTILLLICLSLFIASCGNESKNSDDSDDDSNIAEVSEGASIICLWSSLTLKASPEAKGKYITAIYLGETAVFIGETSVDSTNIKKPVEYVKIKLKDGTKGWVQSNFIAIDAKAYAVKNETKLYKRPDILSAGKDVFEQLQFVVALEEQDGWVKVKGKKRKDGWFKEGWVKVDNLTNTETDITVAILVERALSKSTPETKIEALNEILSNSDLSSSIFMSNVREIINSNTNESVIETENEEEYEGD